VTPLPHTVLAELPAVPESVSTLRHKAREVAERVGADEQVASDIQLAVSEAATNVVVHAFREADPGTLALAAEAHNGEVVFEVIDDGEGLTPRADSPGLGLGLGLMAHEAHRCEIRSSPTGGTEVVLRFELSPAPVL
jgi:anti-sigma regulatory factor (Ser/Thr protein kinase)